MNQSKNQSNFDRLFASLATAGVVIGVVMGFWLLGSPMQQRQIRSDQQRSQHLFEIATALHQQAQAASERDDPELLPESLPEEFSRVDPISNEPYEYERLGETEYQLCAVFVTDSDENRLGEDTTPSQNFWAHPPGRHCFQFDALETPLQPIWY